MTMIRTFSTIGSALGLAAGSLALLAAAPATQPVDVGTTADCCTPVADAKLAHFAAPATRPADAAQKPDAAALFEKLKSMAGTWNGEAMGQPVGFEYTLTGGGSTVVENQNMHGGMMTMYTLDHSDAGDRILITHYCAAGNQPRMSSPGLAGDHATFEFVDATGMSGPTDPHMHALSLTFAPDGTVTQDWTLFVEGKEANVVSIRLKRAV